MNISQNKVVSLTYKLNVKGSNEIIEDVQEDRPLIFLFGHGNLIKEFENNIEGLKVNDTFEFTLESKDAYGSAKSEAVVDLPKSIFIVDGKMADDFFVVGKVIPMRDSSGRRIDGKVIEIQEDKVKMDFNHPMAGKDLDFKGKVLDIREATAEELQHGHIHGIDDCGGCSGCEDPTQGCS